MTFRRSLCAALVALSAAACAPTHLPAPPQPPATRYVRVTVWTGDGQTLADGTVTLRDDFGHQVTCAGAPRLECQLDPAMLPGWQPSLHVEAPGFDALDVRLTQDGQPARLTSGSIDVDDLTLQSADPPLLAKADFIHTYQGNFGGRKLPGCGLDRDNAFDPFGLILFKENPPCYEAWLAQHGAANDNVVWIDPRSGYHGHNDVDMWHDPATFAAFVRDVRRHRNARGEPIRVQVFFGGDGHIDNMRAPGAFDHWKADVDALAATGVVLDSVVPCWECRHINDWTSAAIYYEMLAYLGQKFPGAVVGVHLVQNSSSPSSWPCDPLQAGSCRDGAQPEANDLDDPARGNEVGGWVYMSQHHLADVFYFQFVAGPEYRYLDSYPADPENGNQRGAARRWWEVAVRLGDDPQSQATSRAAHPNGDHFGWPVQVPIIAAEFIYDFYTDADPSTVTEALQVKRCQQFLAIGGWGCGSASYRRPQ